MRMKSVDQADTGDHWRMQLREMRTRSVLRAAEPPLDEVRRLSDRELSAAAQNPDHSVAGRAAAEAELRARNVSIDRWRIHTPGFIQAQDLAQGERLFFGWGRAVRVWSGALVYLALLGAVALAALDAAGAPFVSAPSERQFGYLGLAVLAPLAVWIAATALRRKPARVTLLRKFNERDLAEPLGRMIAKELRPFGHVAALSDTFIRRERFGWVQGALLSLSNPVAAAWFLVGLPIRFVWRLFDRSAMGPAVVLNARDYRHLAKRLRDRIGLNLQVALVAREALLIRTSDAWWRMVARLLLESSDAVVVDLSQVSAGLAWELDLILQEGALKRCVFVSLWGKLDEAEAALKARGVDAPVFHYAPDGEIQRRRLFRAAMLEAMRATHGAPA